MTPKSFFVVGFCLFIYLFIFVVDVVFFLKMIHRVNQIKEPFAPTIMSQNVSCIFFFFFFFLNISGHKYLPQCYSQKQIEYSPVVRDQLY